MANMEYTWPAGSFDAIGIRARDASVTVLGTDVDEVRLESDGSEKKAIKLNVDQLENWLWISVPTSGKDIKFNLLLPKEKPWLIDLYARNINFRAENIQARLNLIMAKGEVKLDDCRGALTMASANASVTLKRFREEQIPEMPPLPESERKKRRVSPAVGINMTWGKDDWSQWGLELGEKMMKGFLGQKGGGGQHRGINVKLAKGDFLIEDSDAEICVIRSARSDVRMKTGRVSNLDLTVISGNIESDSCVPGDEWKIKAHSGNISLSLPSDTNARIDAATRHGDIKSVTPLVRVTRQGPEPWHGRRMVGIIGSVPDKKTKVPEIHLSALRGDIKIETKQLAGQYTAPPEAPSPPPPPSPVGETADSYQTQMAVLEALSEQRITVREAEEILDSLESEEKAT